MRLLHVTRHSIAEMAQEFDFCRIKHICKRHTGKKEENLVAEMHQKVYNEMKRGVRTLEQIRNDMISSSFDMPYEQTINLLVRAALLANADGIVEWANSDIVNGEDYTKHFEYQCCNIIGRQVSYGEKRATDCTRIRVVLKKSAPGDIEVCTAYPVI